MKIEIEVSDERLQEAADYGFDEHRLAEYLVIGSQARHLNVIARLALIKPEDAYETLQATLMEHGLHTDLEYLKACLLTFIEQKLTEQQTNAPKDNKSTFKCLMQWLRRNTARMKLVKAGNKQNGNGKEKAR